MINFQINFANLNIEVTCNYGFTMKFCEDYLSEGEADFSVLVTERDIDEEISVSEFNPSRGYAESICVYREIAKKLPFFDKVVFHGAVISYGGRGYLFTAPSGTGKTTHISLWQKYLDGVDIVNGDKPILSLENGYVTAYATPYAGKEGYQNHGEIMLSGICIIHRGEENRIRRVEAGEVVTELLHQIYLPREAETVGKTLDFLDTLLKCVPVYILECDMSEEAVKTSFEAMTGERYEVKGNEN